METRDLLNCLSKGAPEALIIMKPSDLKGFADEARKSKPGRVVRGVAPESVQNDGEDEAPEAIVAAATTPQPQAAPQPKFRGLSITSEKAEVIQALFQVFPDARISDVARALGCSRKAIYKWRGRDLSELKESENEY